LSGREKGLVIPGKVTLRWCLSSPKISRTRASKICGLTSLDQTEAVIATGADAIGFNFWPHSKRYLPLDAARSWLPNLTSSPALIAVVVNPDAELLDALINSRLFHSIQLHGDESPQDVATLMARGVHIIKALQVRDESSLLAIADYPCPDILLDAFNPGLYGGVGEPFPWHLFELARQRFPQKRLILSGGLTPENIVQAVTQTRPAAIDVASGVESSPGIKDLDKVRAFITQARSV
jgi:phosphoribosylanthranilate isomerase